MATITNPFEKGIEDLATGATSTAKKKLSDAAKKAVDEVKQQLMPDYNKPVTEQMGLNEVSSDDKKKIEAEDKARIQALASRFKDINSKMLQARDQREKEYADRLKTENKEKAEKNKEEQQRKADPLWKRVLKGKTGSREAHQRASG